MAFQEQLRSFPASQLEPKAIFGIANAYFKLREICKRYYRVPKSYRKFKSKVADVDRSRKDF